MSLRCNISGNVTQEPVITSTGYVFEKRLLEKFIQEEGRVCPLTKEELPEERGIIPLQEKELKSLEGAASSIPQLLSKLESEMDMAVLENFRLRGLIDKLKTQLSHSLYQHDAACRVIARLTRESELLKNQMKEFEAEGGVKATKPGLPEANIKDINTLSTELCAARRAKTFISHNVDVLDSYVNSTSINVHDLSNPGIFAMKWKKVNGGVHVFTGGADGAINITDLTTNKKIANLDFHTKAVTCLDVHVDAPLLISGSRDKSIKISLDSEKGYSPLKVLKQHTDTLTSVEIHPLGSLALSCSLDGLLTIMDLEKTMVLNKATHDAIYKASFHPDGTFLICGSNNGVLSTVDVRSAGLQASQTLNMGESRKLNDLSFSENGYFLATTDQEGDLKIWDLRKATCPLSEESLFSSPTVVNFSREAHMLAVGGKNDNGDLMHLLSIAGKGKGRELKISKPFNEGGYDVTALRFVDDGGSIPELLTAGSDNVLRLWKKC